MATLKTCFRCKNDKPLSEFYRHPEMLDGHIGKCKECTREDVRNHREKNFEKVRAYDRQRASLEHRKEKAKLIAQRYEQQHPERRSARSAVRSALRKGVLEKMPCWVCGEQNSEAHHPDYSMPLDIVWLCSAHHKQAHAIATVETGVWRTWNLKRGVKDSYRKRKQ